MPFPRALFRAHKALSPASDTIPVLRPVSEIEQERNSERDPKWCVCVVTSVEETTEQRQSVREGIILDAGSAGARVRFRSKSRLPGEVTIKASRIGLERVARVIWQDEFDAGLAYIDKV